MYLPEMVLLQGDPSLALERTASSGRQVVPRSMRSKFRAPKQTRVWRQAELSGRGTMKEVEVPQIAQSAICAPNTHETKGRAWDTNLLQ